MKNPSNPEEENAPNDFNELRRKILGLGEGSVRKSYYPALQQKIRELEQHLEALRQSEENLRITLNSIGDAVIATDCQCVVTRINNVASNLTGWPPSEAVGRKIDDVLKLIKSGTRRPLPPPIEKVLSSGQVIGLEGNTILISRNGKEYQIADSAAPILNRGNKIAGVVMVFRDITLEHKLEEQLFQAQKMESIGQLAGGVAHDFNNMLTGIMAASDMLRRKIDVSDPGVLKLLDIITGSCRRSADLTNKLLSFARKGKLLSLPHNLHKSINAAIELLERSIDRKIGITLSLEATCSTINGDPAQLDNLFLNLGLNARDAMPDGGTITISTRNVYLSGEYNRDAMLDITPGNYIHVTFSDTGTGIPPEHLPRIFEPFFTTKQVGEGTGLGLSAVYGTIKEHLGAIKVNSVIGQGTVFHLYFPCITNEDSEQIKLYDSQEITRLSGQILIIDDEQYMRETAKTILCDMGCTVMTASDGESGLEIFRRNCNEIDLVILDMIMPKLGGKECLEGMKKIKPDVKVIISTGFTSEKALEEINRNAITGILKKPFTVRELFDAVKNMM